MTKTVMRVTIELQLFFFMHFFFPDFEVKYEFDIFFRDSLLDACLLICFCVELVSM